MRKLNYADLLKDYNELIDKHGDPEDMTGGYVDGDKFRELLQEPTKAKAAIILKSIIDYGFQEGDGSYRSENYGKIFRYECAVVDRLYRKYYEDFAF